MTSIIRTDAISSLSGLGTISVESGNTLVQPGMILQTVQTLSTNQFTTSGTAYVDMGFTASITPKYATSKILVDITMFCGEGTDAFPAFKLMRGSTQITNSTATGPGATTSFGYVNTGADARDQYLITPVAYKYLDSPNTTSNITYSIQVSPMRTASRTFFFNRSQTIGDGNQMTTTSTITLTEIAA